MKILYFTNVPAPYRVNFFNLLNKNNDVTVMFDYVKYDERNKDWYKNNKYDFKTIQLKKNGFFQLNKILKKGNYDIVIIGTYATFNGALMNLLLRLKRIKFFINADGGIVPQKESFISKFLKRRFLGTGSYYLSSGRVTDKYLINYGAKKEKIFHYPLASFLDNDYVKNVIPYKEKMELRKEKGFNYKRLYVSVGSFIYRKGYDNFLKANIFNDKNVGYLIIGGGEDKNLYKKIIEERNIKNVHLIDFCDKKEIINYYKMSDIFFFPSREDIWGLVINEAMACGLPVISGDNVMASCELIEKKYLYNVDDLKKLEKIVDNINNLTNKELEKIGERNLEIIREYSIEKSVECHELAFNQVLKK